VPAGDCVPAYRKEVKRQMIETIKSSTGLKVELFGVSMFLLVIPLIMANDIVSGLAFFVSGALTMGMGYISVLLGH
jgi:hypothetical protein